MKAVIIADNDLVIENVRQVLKSRSYDTIVYRWLLKALDNLEEIAPHLVIVSQCDYPRHWKTITQFAKSGIAGYFPQVILYTKDDFSDEEKEKAEALGVRGTFSSVDVEGLDVLREILERDDDIFAGEEAKIEEPVSSSAPLDEVEAAFDEEEEMEVPTVDSVIAEAEESAIEEPVIEEPALEEEAAPTEDVIEEPVFEEEPAPAEEFSVEDFGVTEQENEPAFEETDLDDSDDTADSETEVSEEKEIPGVSIEMPDVLNDDSLFEEQFVSDDFGDGYEHISFMFKNPRNGLIVTGTTSQFNGSSMEFLPDFSDFAEGLELGNELDFCTIKRGIEAKRVSAQITDKTADGLMLFIRDI